MNTITRPQLDLTQADVTRTILTIYQPDHEPRKMPIDARILSIGRSDDQDIQIDDVGVSRHHAQIIRQRDGWYIRDCGSSNGTWLKSERLPVGAVCRWEPNEPLQIGRLMMMLEIESAAVLIPKERAKTRPQFSDDTTAILEPEAQVDALTVQGWRTGENFTLAITNNRESAQLCKVSVDGEHAIQVSGICWEIEVAANDTVWLPYELFVPRKRWGYRRTATVKFIVSAESGGWGMVAVSINLA